MIIFSNEKMELEYDSFERNYTLSINDKYGHYIDSINLDKEDISYLYKALEEHKASEK